MGRRFAGRAARGCPVAALEDFMIHLDTSFLIRVTDPRSPENRKIRGWIRKGETFAISTVAWAEFLCGPLNEQEFESAAEIVDRYEDFTLEHASVAARLFNESGRRRGSLADCMIAATALGARAPIATCNAFDFRRFREHGVTIA